MIKLVPNYYRELTVVLSALLLIVWVSGCTQAPAGSTGATDDRLQIRATDDESATLASLFAGYDLSLFRTREVTIDEATMWADSVYAGMSPTDRAGQLVIADLDVRHPEAADVRRARKMIRDGIVSGFLVSRIAEPDDLRDLIDSLQLSTRLPLLIAADYERGAGRFSNNLTELPSAMAIGATGDTIAAAAAGRLSAMESRAVGVNFLLAPVADVPVTPNPIIGLRAFSDSPDVVAAMASAFVREASTFGSIPTLKHFPGHGAVASDTHVRSATIELDVETLDSIHFAPYRTLQPIGFAYAVMVGHIGIRGVDSGKPATLSAEVTQAILRERLRFDGVAITDDLRMAALDREFSGTQRLVMAVNAGADLLLTPPDAETAAEQLATAMRDGRIDGDRFEEAVKRVLVLKARRLRQPLARDVLDYLQSEPRGQVIADWIAAQSVTLLAADPLIFPIEPGTEVDVVQVSNFDRSESISAAMDAIEAELTDRGVAIRGAQRIRPIDGPVDVARSDGPTIVVLHLRLAAGRLPGIRPDQRALVDTLASRHNSVLVLLGDPYSVAEISQAGTLVVGYDQTIATIRAVADVLTGKSRARGMLPVNADPVVRR